MLPRSRVPLLVAGGLCLVVVAVLAVLVDLEWGPLIRFDDSVGEPSRSVFVPLMIR